MKKLSKIAIFFSNNIRLTYFIMGFFVLSWFNIGNFISGGDFSRPIFFSVFLKYTSYIWDNSINFGYLAARQIASLYPYAIWGFILEKLGLSVGIIQLIIFYISFSISGFGFYLLSKQLGLNKRGSFIAGTMYMFSPYALVVAWVPVYGITFPFYCFLPLGIYFFLKFLLGQNKLYILLFIFLFMGASYSNPAFFILYIFIITLFLLYYLTVYENKKKLVLNYIYFIFSYIILNLFRFLPFIYDIVNQFSLANNTVAGLMDDKSTMILNSVSILDAIRMTGLWTIHAEQELNYYYDWHNVFYSNLYIFFSFILIIIGLSSLLLDKQKKILTTFLVLFFLLAVVINSGNKLEGFLNNINEVIFSIDFLERAFRSMYLKLGLLLVIPISLLIGISFDKILVILKNKLKFIFITLFLSLFIIIYGLPFLLGTIIKSQDTILPSYNTKIPSEYYQMSDLDKNIKLDIRYLSLPIPRSYNHLLKWENGGYNGSDFLRMFINGKSLIHMNEGSFIIDLIVSFINQGGDINKIAGLLNVMYIFSHKDINLVYPNNYISNIKIDNYKLENHISNKYFEIKKISDQYFLPHFYVPIKIISVNDKTSFLDALYDNELRKLIYMPKQNNGKNISYIENNLKKNSNSHMEFKKVSPVKYRILLYGFNDNFPLVFSEAFHPSWNIYIGKSNFEKKGNNFVSQQYAGVTQNDNLSDGNILETFLTRSLFSDTHILANGYANGWIIDIEKLCSLNACSRNSDGTYNFELIVELGAQKIFLISLFISISFYIIMFFLFIRDLLMNKKDKNE